jgi:hypothetical protein
MTVGSDERTPGRDASVPTYPGPRRQGHRDHRQLARDQRGDQSSARLQMTSGTWSTAAAKTPSTTPRWTAFARHAGRQPACCRRDRKEHNEHTTRSPPKEREFRVERVFEPPGAR